MQQVMGVKKLVALIECVLLLLTLLGVGFAEKEIRELLSGSQAISASEERDENSAQSLWAKCGLELSKLKEVSEDLGFSNLEISGVTDGNTPKDEGSTEENVQKALSILHSLLGNNPFDCLKEEYVVLPVSGEEESHTIWYPRHVKSILSKMDKLVDLRRRLDHELLETATTAAPAATPSPPPSPRNSLHPPKRPARTPTPPPSPAPPPSLKPHASNSKSKTSKSSSRVPIVIAVVLTAAVTFFVSAVIFLCCRKVFHKSSGYEYKDDSPLLSLSLSDSAGSSGKSYVVDNSFKKMGSQSYDADFSHKNGTGALDGKSSVCNDIINGSAIGVDKFSEKITNTYIPSLPLKPPPGKIGASPPEMIPLKPPSGRVDPLPSEPPASLRPSPSKAGPPRPPLAPPSKTPSGVAPQPPPPPPPASSGSKPGPRPPPPPPPKIGGPPPHPPSTRKASGSAANGDVDEGSKTKLKPFFWDKVPANPDHSMVWHQIKSGSFQFNEEMIETLFGYNLPERRKNGEKKESSSHDPPSQLIQIIDSKKAQNLSILLRALNVTIEEACDALQEGNELPTELLETLVKMAPTPEEELKLRLFSGDPSRLGPAERFLKVLIEIPFAFKRFEALLFMSTLQEEVSFVNESFTTLEVACRELRGSRLFLKLLEAVLKTGNRMNDGTFRGGANAFKLDTLLKLSDVRGTDGKTTLLHFVVQEIIRTEGVRAARELGESHSLSSVNSDDLLDDTADDAEDRYRSLGLQVVSGLGGQLEKVKKAACLDADELTGTISKLRNALIVTRDFLDSDAQSIDEESGFRRALKEFVQRADGQISSLFEEEKRIMGLVKSTADYFHGIAGKEEGLRLFVVVRDFLKMLEKACREVKEKPRKASRTQKREIQTRQPSAETPPQPPPDSRQRLFPAIAGRRVLTASDSASRKSLLEKKKEFALRCHLTVLPANRSVHYCDTGREMALNPQLFPNGMPVPFVNELFVLARDGVEFEVDKIPGSHGGKVKAKGTIYLSNIRMVFVAKVPVGNLTSFDMPLLYVSGEKFNQPIFHCNNISGFVEPVVPENENRALYSTHSFKILFKEGGCGTFVPLFFNLINGVRQYNQQFVPAAEPPRIDPLQAGQTPVEEMMRHAYVDPNDPTKIFLQQPTPQSNLRRRTYHSHSAEHI